MEEYVVQPKDTLASIAAKRLGDASRWREIARLNNLEGSSRLLVGQRLKLPAAARTAAPTPDTPSSALRAQQTNGQTPASLAMARGYMFVLFEQLPDVGPRKVIRKVAVVPKNFALSAPNPTAGFSLAEHALGDNKSKFLSSSNKPFGSPTMGKASPSNPGGWKSLLLIDLEKAKAAGARVFTVEEVVADLNRHASQNPALRTRVNQLIWAIEKVEGEVLIQGGVPGNAVKRVSSAHTPYISTADELWASFAKGKINKAQLEAELASLEKGYNKAKIVGRVGRVLTVVGVVFTVKDVADATQRSAQANSYKPLAAETIRQVGGWGGALAGAKIGAVGGALFGIETGPGAILTGAAGAIIFGALGYFGADLIADEVEKDALVELRKDVRSTDAMQTKGITLTIGQSESQYDFARRALIRAAFNAGVAIASRQVMFAEKFYPAGKSIDEKAEFTINWISGDPNPSDGKRMKAGEWEKQRGKEFTYYLNEAEAKELINAMLIR